MTGPAVPQVETIRLLLRGWRETDVAPLARIVGDPEVTRFLFGGGPLDLQQTHAVYERRVASWHDRGLGFWAVELKQTGTLIGWAGLQYVPASEGYVGEVEVGWTLARECWGRGLATEAAEASLSYGFGSLDLERIYAFHIAENRRSERVMERLGMEPAGESVDPVYGEPEKVRVVTRQAWREWAGRRHRPDPHRDPRRLLAVLGYECPPEASVASALTPPGLRSELLAALERSWPGPELPGDPRAYEAAGDPSELGMRMSTERSEGHVPLLVVAALDDAADAGDRLAAVQAAAAREGVWLHADVAVRHGVEFERLSLADSIAFDVPAPDGRRRVFATRHPRILDAGFTAALLADKGARGDSARMNAGT